MSDLADALEMARQNAYYDPDESANIISVLSRHFAGLDIQFRNPFGRVSAFGKQHGWPHAWRARLLTSKNERAEFRITAYGDTMDAALQALAGMVARVDLGGQP